MGSVSPNMLLMIAEDSDPKTKIHPLPESTFVEFDNGAVSGWGYIRGIALQETVVLGYTYIVEITHSNLDQGTYPYTCLIMHGCHIL